MVIQRLVKLINDSKVIIIISSFSRIFFNKFLHPEVCLGCSSKQIEQTFGTSDILQNIALKALNMNMTLVYMSICYTNYLGEYELMIVISKPVMKF